MTLSPGPAHEPNRQQVLEWAACGLAVAAARFVPVPVLDDVIRERATQVAVSRTLTAHGRSYSSELVEPLFDPDHRRRRSTLRRLTALPRKLLLFPVRKWVALFGSVRGGPADVLGVVLLGRAVDRCLDAGRLAGPDPQALAAEAATIRAAYETAKSGVDLRLVGGALSVGLSEVKELTVAAASFARRFLRRSGPSVSDEVTGDGPVREGAERVEQVLERPEIADQLHRFDDRFDAALAGARARA